MCGIAGIIDDSRPVLEQDVEQGLGAFGGRAFVVDDRSEQAVRPSHDRGSLGRHGRVSPGAGP